MSSNRTAPGTLARETLTKMAVRLAIVIVASTAIGYFHIYSALESQAREQLEKYVIERGQRERSLFALAQDNLAKLKQELLRQLKKPEKQDPQEEFNQLFVKQKDGVTSNRPESFDHTRQAGVFIDDQVTITADVRRLVLTFYNLANAYGPAWVNRFPNTYFMTPENFSVGYWPGFNFIQEVTADTYEPGEEYFWVADKVHNPQRKTVWTGLYYDRVAKLWTVSCVAPIDVGNRHVASVGHDVPLNELIKRTVNGQLKGTYNIIFRKDGRLIAHPKLIKQLQASEGKFDILKSGDEHLKSIFQQVKAMKPGEVVIDSTKDGEYLAVTTIPGPDWYFVVVFPKSILSAQAFKTARFILILGIVSLLVELLVLFFVLRNQIAAPLKQFLHATKQLAEGNLNVKLDATRQDELGHLADSFNSMAHAIGERDVQLVDQNRLLGQSEKRFRSLVQNSSDVIAVTATDSTICYISSSVKQILGYECEDWLGKKAFECVHPDDLAKAENLLTKALDCSATSITPSCCSIELRLRHTDNSWREFEVITNNLLAEPSVAGIVTTYRDITKRKEAEGRLHYNAFHDDLTGLPNRALLLERLEQSVHRAKGHENYLFAVLFLDLDRFKVVNDSLGHLIGDQLLITIAHRLKACLRVEDTVARLGGDEFAILMNDIRDVNCTTNIAERIKQELARPFHLSGREVFTSASIGIVLGNKASGWLDDLLRNADIAMYRAKAQGKARYQVFDTDLRDQSYTRLQLETDLRQALERQEFRVYYQPVVSLETGIIMGFEALLRWQHPTRGLIMPAEIIPVAEETGLIIPVGQWVLQEACRQMHQWQTQFPKNPPLTISVNLSVKQFAQPDLIEQVSQILQQTNFAAGSLRLEITESVFIDNAESVTAMLLQLKGLGVLLSLDDFGTGYSSLSYLHRFPISSLKIDRSFVSRMGFGDKNSKIVQTIILLAQTLEIEVIAEGIETAEQQAQLTALHCQQGQGYLFSKPLDSATAGALISLCAAGGKRTSFDVQALLQDVQNQDSGSNS